MLTPVAVEEAVRQQRQFFATGKTKDVAFRIAQLERLKRTIKENEGEIFKALQADLHKPEVEAYFEVIVSREIDIALKQIKTWVKPKRAKIPIDQFPASARIYPEPLGVVLIIGAWNYPLSLVMGPLIGAIAAGNCAIVKPSEMAPHTSHLVTELIHNSFDPAYIAAIEGSIETSQKLLAEKFDYIFFTGSTHIGKIVMEAAAKTLTPVTLELGGKSPCIVEPDIDIEVAARRIAWGKFLNAGQTCIAPDYLLVHRAVKKDLVAAIQRSIREFYGEDPAASPDYARIISDKHFSRISALLQDGDIVAGGQTNPAERYIAPTVMENVSLDARVMQEEIFGPILPVLSHSELSEAISIINSRPKPLALYLFSQDRAKQKQVLEQTSSGGLCLNETVVHFSVPELPFGGVGNSGIGRYHGRASFDTFSNYKSVLKRYFLFDLDLRYPPYSGKLGMLKKILGG
ncbi:MAG: aldehyde dehydrogenase [Oscillatoria sp. SIO1A7]|nr:aldehyde dehydrogenase [Oscillatoria sp. SIO1A7]